MSPPPFAVLLVGRHLAFSNPRAHGPCHPPICILVEISWLKAESEAYLGREDAALACAEGFY